MLNTRIDQFLAFGYGIKANVANTRSHSILGKLSRKLSLKFNQSCVRSKGVQIGKPLPKIGDTCLADLTLRICWRVSEILISSHQ
jgi:hypothetical protein